MLEVGVNCWNLSFPEIIFSLYFGIIYGQWNQDREISGMILGLPCLTGKKKTNFDKCVRNCVFCLLFRVLRSKSLTDTLTIVNDENWDGRFALATNYDGI